LLVEDDAAVRRVVAELLERQGHDVTIAEDGDAGLQLAHEHLFDVVLTDLGMELTSGVDVATTLRRTRPHLPVVLLSGAYVDDDELPESLVDYPRLMKPFGSHELAAAIARVMSATAGAAPPGAR
jgi:CheY-like chemotaxis protein